MRISTLWRDTRGTWFAHGLVSWLVVLFCAWVWNHPVGGATGALIGYLVKEISNLIMHYRTGDLMTPDPKTGVTPLVDCAGDLVGPTFVFLMVWSLPLWNG